jgi:hypothetical protein
LAGSIRAGRDEAGRGTASVPHPRDTCLFTLWPQMLALAILTLSVLRFDKRLD